GGGVFVGGCGGGGGGPRLVTGPPGGAAWRMAGREIKGPVQEPSLFASILPLIVLVVLIGGAIALFGLDALDGPIPAALVVCAMVAALVILKNGHPWEEIQRSGQRALSSITSAIFILLAVGALIGTWCLSGTIPTLVYYGIKI